MSVKPHGVHENKLHNFANQQNTKNILTFRLID